MAFFPLSMCTQDTVLSGWGQGGSNELVSVWIHAPDLSNTLKNIST